MYGTNERSMRKIFCQHVQERVQMEKEFKRMDKEKLRRWKRLSRSQCEVIYDYKRRRKRSEGRGNDQVTKNLGCFLPEIAASKKRTFFRNGTNSSDSRLLKRHVTALPILPCGFAYSLDQWNIMLDSCSKTDYSALDALRSKLVQDLNPKYSGEVEPIAKHLIDFASDVSENASQFADDHTDDRVDMHEVKLKLPSINNLPEESITTWRRSIGACSLPNEKNNDLSLLPVLDQKPSSSTDFAKKPRIFRPRQPEKSHSYSDDVFLDENAIQNSNKAVEECQNFDSAKKQNKLIDDDNYKNDNCASATVSAENLFGAKGDKSLQTQLLVEKRKNEFRRNLQSIVPTICVAKHDLSSLSSGKLINSSSLSSTEKGQADDVALVNTGNGQTKIPEKKTSLEEPKIVQRSPDIKTGRGDMPKKGSKHRNEVKVLLNGATKGYLGYNQMPEGSDMQRKDDSKIKEEDKVVNGDHFKDDAGKPVKGNSRLDISKKCEGRPGLHDMPITYNAHQSVQRHNPPKDINDASDRNSHENASSQKGKSFWNALTSSLMPDEKQLRRKSTQTCPSASILALPEKELSRRHSSCEKPVVIDKFSCIQKIMDGMKQRQEEVNKCASPMGQVCHHENGNVGGIYVKEDQNDKEETFSKAALIVMIENSKGVGKFKNMAKLIRSELNKFKKLDLAKTEEEKEENKFRMLYENMSKVRYLRMPKHLHNEPGDLGLENLADAVFKD